MELPQTLLDRYHVSKPKPKKVEVKREPMMRTYPALVTFDTGESMDMQLSVRNKAYWGGQIEHDFMQAWNSNPQHEHKIVRVKLFRNSTEGGFIVDTEHGRVINVY